MDFACKEVMVLAKHNERTIRLREQTKPFNYVKMDIRSDLYLKGFLILEDSSHNFIYQPFYVEPGVAPVTFFINGKEESCDIIVLNGIVVQNLENKMGRVEISNINLSTKEPYKGQYVLEDGDIYARFDSQIGPVISFITTKKYTVTESSGSKSPIISFSGKKPIEPENNCNFINTYDNGRFPQQSWYGTGRPPYNATLYKETVWVFNPVQAGDHKGNLSRVADFKVTEKSVYFKIIPLDWSKDNQPLDCYMEVEYSLLLGTLKVENRFIDFSLLHSGGEIVLQGLPTFNTIASLNRFCYCPTGKGVVKEFDLGFWTGENQTDRQTFRTKTCWSAWTNEQNYGVGLFTPYLEEHLAGKFDENSAEYIPSDKSKSVNYFSAVGRFGLCSLHPVEYSFYVTIGGLNEIGEKFTSIKPKKNAFLQSLRDYHV